MIGFLATLSVISQMALLSLGFSAQLVMSIGLAGCVLWIYHASIVKDKWLLLTNIVVALFAVTGLT